MRSLSSMPYFWALLLPLVATAADAKIFYYEKQHHDSCLCQGSWVIPQLPPEALQPIMSWEIAKQSFRLKEQVVDGQNVSVWGRGLAIQAPQALFRYAPLEEQYWHFSQGVSLLLQGFAAQTDQLEYYQAKGTLMAQETEFFLEKQEFYGQCRSLTLDDKKIMMQDLQLTSCPPEDKVWDLRSPGLVYDREQDVLTIEKPSLYVGDYALLTLPTMAFTGARAQHRLENLPRVSVATGAGMGISFPLLWTREQENIEVIPDINLKRGPGIGVNIEKNSVLTRGYLQLFPPSATAKRYWMVEVISAGKHDNFSYAYQGSLMNDDDFAYKYPNMLLFEDRLYYVNRAWARHNIGRLGQVQFYGEKLFRTQEAREPGFEVIENTAHLQWDFQDNLLTSQWGFDHFYRYHDKSYFRGYGEQHVYWHRDRHWRFKLLQYPDENFGYGLSEAIMGTPQLDIGVGQFNLLFLGRLAADYGSSPLIDTIAQPLSFQSLSTLHWHQGRDWVSHGLQLTPQLTLDLNEDITACLQVSYALDRPTRPWIEESQPYLTPFRGHNRFSPVGIQVKGQQWEAQALFDGEHGEWVSSEWRRSLSLAQGQTQLGVYYHKYFPLDRLSRQTTKVAQFLLQHETDPLQPWIVKLETRFNLIPVKLERAILQFKYQHCCWNAGIKASAIRQYDCEDRVMKWQYRFNFSIELVGSGLSSKEGRKKAFVLMPQRLDAESINPFYRNMMG